MAKQYKLPAAIIALSVAKTWDEARLEWQLDEIYYEDRPDTCLCGHFPINELCYLRNTRNYGKALVGNVCVKKFFRLPSDKIFEAIQRIAIDITKALNPDAIEHAFRKAWISQWERDFYLNTWRKRSLSPKQNAKRVQINNRVMQSVRNARGSQRNDSENSSLTSAAAL
jgi:hypothetical protein